MANHLIAETSPYLLQHAHNPVDWYPWSEEALQRARNEDKPILVSIGYAACHWCHVMERESFEDEATASLMNEHFINIKIDREERPDLDHIYMDAVQAMTGSGGWPLNVFLTPDARPFYGGTYFPPRRAFNRSSWTEVLQGVAAAFKERRSEIDAQASGLVDHIQRSNTFGLRSVNPDQTFQVANLDLAADNIMKAADREWGGFGNAPKFPQTFTIQYLLRYHHFKNSSPSATSGTNDMLAQALLSLDRMIEGGIYDQLGGGFARYSTDTEWLAPHFEKMLYDNALLVSTLADAYQLTGKSRYCEVIEETIGFVCRELFHPEGGFYSALDADSEGEEGKFYVWQRQEVEEILKEDAEIFCSYYDISNQGNWEGTNILRVKQSPGRFAAEQGLPEKELQELLRRGRDRLLQLRSGRIRPLLDDKVLLGWNGLMNEACSRAFEATGKESYRRLAIKNMKFLLASLSNGSAGEFYHTWKEEKTKYPAFLDDYAFLVQALLRLHSITADNSWLQEARKIASYVVDHFSDEEQELFYFTSRDQRDVIVRKKEVYDGAVPSGNSGMAVNLNRLAIFFDLSGWKERSYRMVAAMAGAAVKYPTSFGVWNGLLLDMIEGTHELAIVGENAMEVHAQVLKQYIPNKVLMASLRPDDTFPLLKGKPATDPASIYLCRNFECLQPVSTVKDLMSLINSRRSQI
jgi:uncharacterized protein